MEYREWSPQSEQQHLRRSVVMLLRTFMFVIVLATYLWAAVRDNSTPRPRSPSNPAAGHAASIAPLSQSPGTRADESLRDATDFQLSSGYGSRLVHSSHSVSSGNSKVVNPYCNRV